MISQLLDAYRLDRDSRPNTFSNYRTTLNVLSQYLEREIQPDDWCKETLNRHLLWLLETGRSPFTVQQRRTNLGTLWGIGHEAGLLPAPHPLRRIKTPVRLIETWTADEVCRLVEVAAAVPGQFRKTPIPRGPYLSTLILAGYECGLRQSDMYMIRALPLFAAGGVTLVQVKTNFPVHVCFSEATLRAIKDYYQRLPIGYSPYVWPRWARREALPAMMRRLIDAAGLTGSWTTLRKTSATAVESIAPGLGWIHLGHKSPETTRKWYIDRDRAYAGKPLPPPLRGTG